MTDTIAQPDGDSGSAPALRAIDTIRRASSLDRRKIVVPEWEGLELYFPKLTLADVESSTAREAKSGIERNLHLLVAKAQDVAGKPLFATGDISFLKNDAEAAVVQRVTEFMWNSVVRTPEEEADRIRKDPSSGSSSTSPAT